VRALSSPLLATLRAVACLYAAACLAGAPAAIAQERRDLLVQSTTSVRESGLMDQVIGPGFVREHPRYRLEVFSVGADQAIANARAGQADALITHAPALEAKFVTDGFSLESQGRTIMWSDYVIVGQPGDVASVAAAGAHDAAAAFEAIAAAGAAGRAMFVSRGDDSATNAKEKEIWRLTSVARNASDEPAGAGTANPPWYTKAGRGMADTLRLTQQCPSGGCYTIADRGTLQQAIANGVVTALPIVMDEQDASARGGPSLMVDQYRAYALNPVKVSRDEPEGALAFLDFLTSRSFQNRLRSRAGFFPGAFPTVSLDERPDRTISARRTLTVRGSIASAVPGARPLDGAVVRLARFTAGPSAPRLDSDVTGPDGEFQLRWRPDRSGPLFLTTTRFRDLSPSRHALGRVRVRAAVQLDSASAGAGRVRLAGRAWPATGRRRAQLSVLARPASGGRYGEVRRVRLRRGGNRFELGAPLPPGGWDVRVRYEDRGIVNPAISAARSVVVG
jgi:tungstate transport system substrate-binding protein